MNTIQGNNAQHNRILAPIREAIAEGGEVADATCVALKGVSVFDALECIKEAANEPELVRALVDDIAATLDFLQDDICRNLGALGLAQYARS